MATDALSGPDSRAPDSRHEVRARDEVWLAEVFDAHAREVHRYLRRRLHGGADAATDADDLTAEVFAITWRRRDDVDEPVLAWLYGVARRALIAHRRRVTSLPSVDLGDVADVRDGTSSITADVADLVTEDLSLRRGWLALSERDREVLLLAAWDGLSEAQIAAVLGISVGGASSALSRARMRLRDALADQLADQ